jgi:prepilin-type processing-associated H-X9-DG protein
VIVVATVIIGIIGFQVLSRSLAQSRDYAHVLICASNVKALGIAIAAFAHDHDGKLPEKLGDLSQYHTSDKIFFCPSAKDQIHYSYALTGATNVWGVSTNIIILQEDESNHYGRRHVLFADGHVELWADSKL